MRMKGMHHLMVRILTILFLLLFISHPLVGWSGAHLLPTDRHMFSTKCGNTGWNTLTEANEVLLSAGWVWAHGSRWEPVSVKECDSEGMMQLENCLILLMCVNNFSSRLGIRCELWFYRRIEQSRCRYY